MYVFPLQKVLDYRKRKEEEEQLRLNQAFRERDTAKENLVTLQEDLAGMQAKAAAEQTKKINVPQALMAGEYSLHLAHRIKEQKQAVEQLDSRLQEQVQLTEKAMQERKVMDSLRDKGQWRYQQETKLEEQRQNDEMARFMHLYHVKPS
ncbi:flagellar export protein FliJ [Dethiobacter alkaliphilus]|uniref:Flagellar FliJ protein n=1 Tax=Dethiobacter alkaliphilus AHT 1 TaxID=555088 RepID=C0GJH8_DETAL|nr:flagellar export protein FliJ [Dethiobacter alkaliphilus]EEG76525.1 flagellar export protein FliJ [Dethiobacter alkaliphilus AHT 1]